MPGLWEKMSDLGEKMLDGWEKIPELREKIPGSGERMGGWGTVNHANLRRHPETMKIIRSARRPGPGAKRVPL